MIVLGLSGLPKSQEYHLKLHPQAPEVDQRICQGMDSAACLVVDGEVRSAVAEERFTGQKGTGVLPVNAIRYCLESAGVDSANVDVIAHGFNYDAYRRFFLRTPEYFDRALSGATVIEGLEDAGWRSVADRFVPVDHHLAHAVSSLYASGYDRALSIVSDGMGEVRSLSVHTFSGSGIEERHQQGIDSSLGILYSILTRFLGYAFNSDEYKVMGLSAYGDPAPFAGIFGELMNHENGRVRLAWPREALREAGSGYPAAMRFLQQRLGIPVRDGEVGEVHADIAAAFQRRFSEVLTALVEHWLITTGHTSLCLAGGTFLNCLTNQAISELPQVERMFVHPAAGDDGTAVGAALHASGRLTGTFTPYTGPGYRAEDVHRSLVRRERELLWTEHGFVDEYVDLAARDLADDEIIGWFAGRMEFGPRALGNRSILALPNGASIKDRLNHVIKLRESFRPFAPAVLDSDYDELFETPAMEPSRYMLCTARVRPDQRERISGAVHVDGTARVQIVRRCDNETFWRLLTRVKEITGVGCVINTSFNVKNQPIIMAPDGAVQALTTMSLRRLYIEGFRVTRRQTHPVSG